MLFCLTAPPLALMGWLGGCLQNNKIKIKKIEYSKVELLKVLPLVTPQDTCKILLKNKEIVRCGTKFHFSCLLYIIYIMYII